jgi:two-component system response regulator HydG
VDDEPTVSASIKMMLKHYGHEPWTVENGEAAIALCKTQQFDLIITDYYMPDMKGDELSAIIKRDWPGQKILMISAFGHDILAASNSTGGTDAVLTKPF